MMRIVLPGMVLFVLTGSLSAQVVKEPREKKRDEAGLEGLKALRNEDPEVRYKAAAVMVRLGPIAKFASKELREAFREETDLEVKVKLAEAIWVVDQPASGVLTPFLTQALGADEAEVRIGAAGVLGQMGAKGKAAIRRLVQTLKDKELPVRIAAVLALGEMGPAAKEAAEPLLATIHEKEDPLVDTMTAISLGKLGPSVAPLLQATLEDARMRRRLAAAYALGELGPEARDAVPGLVKLLGVKPAATDYILLQALGKIGAVAKEAAPAIERHVEAKDPAIRLEAALAFFLVAGETKHLPIIRGYLSDEKAGMIYEACLALKQFGSKAEECVPELRKLTKDRNFKIRMAAALALWSTTGKAGESLQVYQATIDNSDADIRSRTLEHLTEMGAAARPLLPLIQEAARDEDDFVRNQARNLLMKLKGERSQESGDSKSGAGDGRVKLFLKCAG